MKKKYRAELVIVGDELLLGNRRDAHLFFLASKLRRIGISLDGCTVLGDSLKDIAATAKSKAQANSILIVCGGLGPTADDVTREGIAKGLGLGLEEDRATREKIEKFFRIRGYEATAADLELALLPKGSEAIPNDFGTAPGFYLEHKNCHLFVLPGPPREMNPMVENFVIPKLKELLREKELFAITFRTAGVGESVLAVKLAKFFSRFSHFSFSSLPYLGGVDIVAIEKPGLNREALSNEAREMEEELRKVLGNKFYGKNGETLEEVIGKRLARRRMTLAVAESLSGGLIGKRLTDVPGSSRYFLADVVAYSNEAKKEILGVKEKTLREFGAVSDAVCLEMAEGARIRNKATFGLATTGIAGPGGGSKEKPVGLCYYGVVWEGGSVIKKKIFQGDRDAVRQLVTQASLLLLFDRF